MVVFVLERRKGERCVECAVIFGFEMEEDRVRQVVADFVEWVECIDLSQLLLATCYLKIKSIYL